MKRGKLGVTLFLGCAFGILTLPSTTALAKSEKSRFIGPLVASGGDDDASGKVRFVSRVGKSRFKMRLDGLEASTSYDLFVGGVRRATLTTNAGGKISADLRTPMAGSSATLDFDPRGEAIEIRSGTETLLQNSDGGASPTGTLIDERANLVASGAQVGASGSARFRERKGKRDFDVEIEDVADGAYDLLVDGVPRGLISVVGGEGEIEFGSPSDDPDELPLDFDALGALVQVAQGGTIVLSATLLATAPGVNSCEQSETTTILAVTGPDADASGDARFRVRDDCDRDFRVEVEDLDIGLYELVVDGTVRGTIDVVATIDGTEGEIEFDSHPDDPGELPLDFDPTGAAVEVRQGATVFLSGAAGDPQPNVCMPVDQEIALENAGADLAAKGKARFRLEDDCDSDFRVEIEDLPLGDYDLFVGEIPRGTIPVGLVLGEPEGQIELDNDPDQPGELFLDFDPRGELIEVQQGGIVFLSLSFPQ